jgi:hypothetical protein
MKTDERIQRYEKSKMCKERLTDAHMCGLRAAVPTEVELVGRGMSMGIWSRATENGSTKRQHGLSIVICASTPALIIKTRILT